MVSAVLSCIKRYKSFVFSLSKFARYVLKKTDLDIFTYSFISNGNHVENHNFKALVIASLLWIVTHLLQLNSGVESLRVEKLAAKTFTGKLSANWSYSMN